MGFRSCMHIYEAMRCFHIPQWNSIYDVALLWPGFRPRAPVLSSTSILYSSLPSTHSHNSSSLKLFVMRRMPYSQSNSFEPSFKRQRVDIRPASSQSSRVGMIDQKLIDGSHQPRYPSSFSQEELSPGERSLSLRDEDSQLDAFGE